MDLDFSEILEDPDLSDVFDVKRRDMTVDEATGRGVLAERLHAGIIGVVTPGDTGELLREDDKAMTSRLITVTTKFRLRGTGDNFQPDLIFYDGITFTVKAVKVWTRMGTGFVKAVASSGNAEDAAPA